MNHIRLAAILVALLISAVAHGQELQDGPIQEINEGLRRILKMKWDGDRLVIDRAHWDSWGATTEEEDNLPPGFPRGIRRGNRYPNVIQAFVSYLESNRRSLRSLGGASRSIGRIRDELETGGRLDWTASGLVCMIQIYRGDFMLRIEELAVPHRVFRVYESAGGWLRIAVIGESTLVIQQQADGPATVIQINDDQTMKWRGESLVDLNRKNAEGMKQINERLTHMGFILPEGKSR